MTEDRPASLRADIDQLCINTIRTLAIDAVQAAQCVRPVVIIASPDLMALSCSEHDVIQDGFEHLLSSTGRVVDQKPTNTTGRS